MVSSVHVSAVLLAYVLKDIQSFSNSRAISPYKIIYVLLGGLAIVVGICVLIWLPDSPVHAGFLTKEERIAALERVRDDQGGTENKQFKKEQVRLLHCAIYLHVRTSRLVLVSGLGDGN